MTANQKPLRVRSVSERNPERLKWFHETFKRELVAAGREGLGLQDVYMAFFEKYQTPLEPLAHELVFPSVRDLLSSLDRVQVAKEGEGLRYSVPQEEKVDPNIAYDCDKLTPGSLHRARIISTALGSIDDSTRFPPLQMVLILEESLAGRSELRKLLADYSKFLDADPDEPPERINVGAAVLFKLHTSDPYRCYIEGESADGQYWKLRDLDDGKAHMVSKEEGGATLFKIPNWAAAYPAYAIIACMDYGEDPVPRRKLEDIISKLISSGTTISVEVVRAVRTSAKGRMHQVKIHIHEANEIIYPDRLLHDRQLLNAYADGGEVPRAG